MTDAEANPGTYFATRYTPDPNRAAVWGHVARYLQRWVGKDDVTLELGAGYCDLSNSLQVRRRVAMDIDASITRYAASGVEVEVGDCTQLDRFEAGSFDVVCASNLLEHLDRPGAEKLVRGALRALRSGGRLVLIQPNFRLKPREYFDDYTHVQIFTDRSLADFLASEGYEIEHVEARFLPLTMKSRLSGLHHLVPYYLRSPIRPMAGQMLVIARKPVPMGV